jgi:hypothetical protein
VAHRQITDETGRDWMVWEVIPREMDRSDSADEGEDSARRAESGPRVLVAEHLSDGWLTFETKREKRRLSPIPYGWAELSDKDLLDLLAKATRVKSSRRLLE